MYNENKKFKPLPDVPSSRMHFSTLWDPVQTHALYGVYKWELDKYKDWLKSLGAKRLRIVGNRKPRKTGYDNPYVIICFQWMKA